jgi:hypothetical protein
VLARSAASCSGTLVCRASMCTHDLITIAVTALSAAVRPNSVCKDGHGLCSSFSAMHAEYLAGVPWVAVVVLHGLAQPGRVLHEGRIHYSTPRIRTRSGSRPWARSWICPADRLATG